MPRPKMPNKAINIGLAPDGLTMEERAPLRDYLTKAMGRPVNLMVPDRYSDAVARLADGSYDFACLGGLTYVRAHASNGVIPLIQRAWVGNITRFSLPVLIRGSIPYAT